MRKAAVSILLPAAAAWAGAGMFFAEAGTGVVFGGVCGAGAWVVADAISEDSVDATYAAICFYVAGAPAGVWLAGETWAGPSENPVGAFGGALGGSALGAVAAGVITSLVLIGGANHPVIDVVVMPVAVTAWAMTPPILSAVSYNAAKKPVPADAGGLTVMPAVAALPPRGRGVPPTLTFGVAAAF